MKRLPALVIALVIAPILYSIDYTSTVNSILSSNPDYIVRKKQAEASILSSSTLNNLENPEVSFEGLFSKIGEKKYNAVISQNFDWPGAYKSRNKVIKATKLLNDAEVMALETSLRSQIGTLLINICATKHKISEYQTIIAGYRDLAALYDAGYKTGNISILDVNKIKIEIANYEMQLAELENELIRQTGDLAIIGANVNAAAIVKDIDAFPSLHILTYEEYYNRLNDANPELLRFKAIESLAKAEGETAVMESMPGLNLGYRFAREDGINFNGFSFAIGLPIWNSKGKRAAANAAINAAETETKTALTTMRNTLERDYSQALALKKQMDAYGEAVIITDNLTLLKRALDGGQISLVTYLQDVNFFTEAKIEFYELQRKYYSMLVNLDWQTFMY